MDNGRLKEVLLNREKDWLNVGITWAKGKKPAEYFAKKMPLVRLTLHLFSQWSLRRHVLPKCPSSLGCRRGQNTIWYVSKELLSGFVSFILNVSGFRISLLSSLISRLSNTVFKHGSKSVQLRRKQRTAREIIMFIGRW